MIIQQITVFMENGPGQLVDLTSVLTESNIDMQAVQIAETADGGIARLIVDRPKKAAEVLREKGFVLRMTPVVETPVPDRPGGLHELLGIVAQAGIDIQYMYSAFMGQKNGLAYMIFRVNDTEKLSEVLKDLT